MALTDLVTASGRRGESVYIKCTDASSRGGGEGGGGGGHEGQSVGIKARRRKVQT